MSSINHHRCFWHNTLLTVAIMIGVSILFYAIPTKDIEKVSPPEKEIITITTIQPEQQTRASVYLNAIEYCWKRESGKGKSAAYHPDEVGPAGERGEYQITPIFIREVKRISGYTIRPMSNISCIRGIYTYFKYWGIRVEATNVKNLYELYRRGPTGYRRMK